MRICFSLFNINELEEANNNINRFVLQEYGILLGGCLTVKNY